jgi:tRNA(His) 5'-end guanylyltransferase
MKPNEFERRMREGQCYHSLRFPPGSWVVLRVDGRSFSAFTESRFEKPFDSRFRDMMIAAARALLVDLQGIYAYTESDEISLLLPRNWSLYDRELEKTVSLAAGIASGAFSVACGEPAAFDGRAWLGSDDQSVVDYFRWRQSDATRCALNGWCYWTLRKAGKGYREATRDLERQSVAWKNEMLFSHGTNFNEVPAWQRRGIGLYHETVERMGTNPVTGEEILVQRRQIKVDMELPMKEAYSEFLLERLAS